jgi:hypothetical protein
MLGFVGLGGASAATIFAPTAIDLTKQPANVATCNTPPACTPTAGTFTTGTYENQLFSNLYPAGTGAPTPVGGLQPFPTNTGITTLPLIIDSQPASPYNDVWYSTSTANRTSALVMDLGGYTGANPTAGLFEVDKVWTMIQGNIENFGTQGVTVTLKGVAADGSTPITDVIALTAGIDYRGTSSANSVTCTDANALNGASATSCASDSSETAQVSGTDSNPGGALSTAGNTVITYNNVYSGSASGTNYWLDVQELDLPSLGNTGSFAGGYLDSITITDTSGASGSGTQQRVYLSALTVDQATPEPGTISLVAVGIGLLGLGRLRVRARKS